MFDATLNTPSDRADTYHDGADGFEGNRVVAFRMGNAVFLKVMGKDAVGNEHQDDVILDAATALRLGAALMQAGAGPDALGHYSDGASRSIVRPESDEPTIEIAMREYLKTIK